MEGTGNLSPGYNLILLYIYNLICTDFLKLLIWSLLDFIEYYYRILNFLNVKTIFFHESFKSSENDPLYFFKKYLEINFDVLKKSIK